MVLKVLMWKLMEDGKKEARKEVWKEGRKEGRNPAVGKIMPDK